MKQFLLLGAFLSGTTAAWADPSALLIGNNRYAHLQDVRYGATILETASDLSGAGVSVKSFSNLATVPLLTELSKWSRALPEDDLLIVALSGRFVNDGAQSWFMGTDAKSPSIFSAAGMGVSVSNILQVMANHPGQSVLVLGSDAENVPVSAFLKSGLGPIDPPQGVTVLNGPRYAVADSLRAFARTDGNLSEAVASGKDVQLSGFSPRMMPLGGRNGAQTSTDTPSIEDTRETAAWVDAKSKDTIASYQSYLAAYPAGANAGRATAMIKDIQSEPNRAARLHEEKLALSRDARREIQRDLSVLGYNTRGIDGILGRGSRAAIGEWQSASGLAKTGYMNATQISRLDGQATRRVAELEAEAERKRKLAARQDRVFWEETGAAGDETGYRAYLTKYPDGDFAETATAELDKIEAKKRKRAAGRDKKAWDQFSATDTPNAYQAYLDQFPQGAFRGEAEAKLLAFQQEAAQSEARKNAKAVEQRLGLTPSMSRLVELRLAQLGLKPGTVDGTFDRSTRRAIRRYQKDRNLDVTGYMNQPTAVRMLSGGFTIKLR